jgi:uncharacterized protein
MSISRRHFLGTVAVSGVAAAAGKDTMPTRVLGKTGARVSILAFGSGSRWLMYKEEDKALAAMSHAIDSGISYIDTAYGYGDGESERRVGLLMSKYRNRIFLATKCNARKYDESMRLIEGSLKRLQTDHVDLLHIHSLTDEADLAAVEAHDGVLRAVQKAKEQKMARFIGVTSHTDPRVLATALERHDFDCTQMALNAARAGMAKGVSGLDEQHEYSFEATALPVANRKKMGVIAMKIFAQEGLSGRAPADKLVRYSMSLPVTAVVIGMPKLEYIDANIAVAKAFEPMSPTEMKGLSDHIAGEHKLALDRYFSDHVDC